MGGGGLTGERFRSLDQQMCTLFSECNFQQKLLMKRLLLFMLTELLINNCCELLFQSNAIKSYEQATENWDVCLLRIAPEESSNSISTSNQNLNAMNI